ncbi:hypothetical protein ACFSFY_16700 [Sporosarcina siberiensis]|uniref:YlaH-like protein n=1 Tax=Sporosarcina siberiensis TaxID=1365606 RepID=A0ABW4SM60_9BACL
MTGMELLGIIRWVLMGVFVVLFYLYEIKKKAAFMIPAHLTILAAIILHALVRDWYLFVKIAIIIVAVLGIGGNILKLIRARKNSVA